MHGEIANSDLRESHVPLPDAGWHEIGRFALSFNGYEAWGSFRKCADVADRWADAFRATATLPDSLNGLRTCLFFEQRRWRHFGYEPDEEAMRYICALVEEIRKRVGG